MKRKVISTVFSVVLIAVMAMGCGKKEETKTEESKAEVSGKTAVDTSDVEAVDQTKVFVTPEWLKSVMDGNQKESSKYVVLEVSWGTADDSPDYKKGHIPGALHVDTSSVESEEFWNLREPEEIEKGLLDLGITKDTTVILYGLDTGAARVAYSYLWAGVENVKVLNGGLAAWEKTGYETETKEQMAKAVQEFGTTVPAHPEYWISLDETREKLENDTNFRLVSIRSKAEYDGETSGYNYIDRAGEPKGAIWGHAGSDSSAMEDYLNEDGTYIGIDQAEQLWEGSDLARDNELSFYCGTGWRATVPWLICYEAGYENIRLYDGGWYQWQLDDTLPVQVGDPASGKAEYTTVGKLPTDKAAK